MAVATQINRALYRLHLMEALVHGSHEWEVRWGMHRVPAKITVEDSRVIVEGHFKLPSRDTTGWLYRDGEPVMSVHIPKGEYFVPVVRMELGLEVVSV